LGLVYRNTGDYQKAEGFYERTLRIREEIYTPNHPMALATKNNIAQVYASEEGDTEAIDICTKGLDMRKAI
jgi:tetratricopeptide (TPR) repeat protein